MFDASIMSGVFRKKIKEPYIIISAAGKSFRSCLITNDRLKNVWNDSLTLYVCTEHQLMCLD